MRRINCVQAQATTPSVVTMHRKEYVSMISSYCLPSLLTLFSIATRARRCFFLVFADFSIHIFRLFARFSVLYYFILFSTFCQGFFSHIRVLYIFFRESFVILLFTIDFLHIPHRFFCYKQKTTCLTQIVFPFFHCLTNFFRLRREQIIDLTHLFYGHLDYLSIIGDQAVDFLLHVGNLRINTTAKPLFNQG